MTKKHTLTLLLAATTLAVQAQKVKISWGDESKKELTFMSMLRTDPDHLLKLSMDVTGGGFTKKRVTPILFRYDQATLSESGEKEILVDDNDVMFQHMFNTHNGLFMLMSRYDKENKATTYYSQRIDPVTLTLSKEHNRIGSFEAISRSRQSSVNYELSKDSSKVLMFGTAPGSRKKSKENESYYMGVFDQDMHKLWDANVELPYQDRYVDIYDYIVTNDGEVGVIIKHYDQEVKRESVREEGQRIPSYKVKLLLYKQGVTKPREYILATDDKYIYSIELTSDVNGNLTLFGLYKQKPDGYITGYLVATVNKESGAIDYAKMNAFPEALIDQIKKDGQGSNKERDPGMSIYFHLAGIKERANHTTDYLLEYNKIVLVTVYNKYGSYTYTDYTYGDVIDINITNAGKTVFTRIPKLQNSRDQHLYSGFVAVPFNNQMLIMYNDNRKNLDRELEKGPKTCSDFGDAELVMATVSEDGGMNRKSIFDHSDTKLTTCISECSEIGPNKIGLYAQKTGGLFTSSKDMVGVMDLQ